MSQSTNLAVSDLEAFLKDVGVRAGKTAWQAGGAAVATTFAGSSLDLAHLSSVPVDGKLVSAAVVAGVGAAASAAYNLVRGYFSARGLRVLEDAAKVGLVAAVDTAASELEAKPMSAGQDAPAAGSAS